MRGRLHARSLAVLLAACAAACTATEEASLGADQPPLVEDEDAGGHEPVELAPEAEAPAPPDAGRAAPVAVPIEPRDAGVRDAGAPTAVVDAGVEVCVQYGPKPLDRWPPDNWDGGLPPLLGNDRLPPPGGGLFPFEFEAGVPPYCCTLMTPWFCPPPVLP